MVLIFVFILGLFIGSFLGVLADRLPREESVVAGRSHCEKCKKNLKWIDLIPLFSFLLLKGKCRYCHTRLSPFYPMVELTTGIIFALTVLFVLNNSQFLISNFQFLINFQLLINLIYYLFIASCLIVVFFADLKYGIIPDKIVFPSIVISFLYLFIIHNSLFIIHFWSAFGACLFFLALFLGTKGKGMGFGDVKFAFLMGLILGFPNIIVSLYIAFLTGAIVGIILVIWKKKKSLKAAIPFGPFLALGTFLALFWGKIIFERIVLLVLR